MRRLTGAIIGIIFVIIGIFVLVTYSNAKKTQTAETIATIIRIDSEIQTDSDGFDTRWYYPVVKYSVNDEEYEKRLPDSGSTNSTEYKEGEEVAISYNPDKPDEFSKKGSKGGLIGGIIFIAMGFIAAIASLFGRM